ncbi:unnamed protein product, partial [Laminaria digitata]
LSAGRLVRKFGAAGANLVNEVGLGDQVPFFFSSLHLLSSPFFSRFLLVVTQIRDHKAGSSPPSPLRYAPSFLSEKSSALSSLVDSRRIVLTHAIKRSRQLVSYERHKFHTDN